MKVAVVHDWLTTIGGAEKVLREILKLYPEADLFALIDFLSPQQRETLFHKKAKTTFLQGFPFIKRLYPYSLSFMPLAIESLDLSAYDLIISSSSCVAKGVLTAPHQLHICYCHSPMRYAWDMQSAYFEKKGFFKRVFSSYGLHKLRLWDVVSANRVDQFIANSDFVAKRIEKFYRRKAEVVHCGVDTDFFSFFEKKEEYYLTVSRLVSYKKVDLLVEAFSQMKDKKLLVIGQGPEYKKLLRNCPPNVTFLGYQSIEELRYYLQRAKAFVFAAREDFGIAPLEALSTGTAVIAFGEGGAKESLQGVGHFFDKQTPQAIREAVDSFKGQDPFLCRKRAEEFSLAQFGRKFKQRVDEEWKRHESTDNGRGKRNEIVAPIAQISS